MKKRLTKYLTDNGCSKPYAMAIDIISLFEQFLDEQKNEIKGYLRFAYWELKFNKMAKDIIQSIKNKIRGEK